MSPEVVDKPGIGLQEVRGNAVKNE
jgi:hypothetical protein